MQGEGWKVEGVCGWLEALGRAQSEGKRPHIDDIRAGEPTAASYP